MVTSDATRSRAEPAPHERQRHRRLVIEPLRVVDEDEDGLCAGCLSATRLRTARPTRNGSSGVVLAPCRVRPSSAPRCGSGSPSTQSRSMQHQLVHCRVPEGHLRFDADDADDTEAGSDVDRVLDQRRLPDAGGAGEQERQRRRHARRRAGVRRWWRVRWRDRRGGCSNASLCPGSGTPVTTRRAPPSRTACTAGAPRRLHCDHRHTGCQVGHRPILAPPVSGLVRPLQFVERVDLRCGRRRLPVESTGSSAHPQQSRSSGCSATPFSRRSPPPRPWPRAGGRWR